MKKNNNGAKIVEGALVGAALAVAAGMFLKSKAGRKAERKTKVATAKFYRQISPEVKKLRSVGEKQLHAFAAKNAKNFAKAKKLSAAEERALTAEAKHSWRHVKKYLPK
ncbi:MAG TPA: hypothetical protein VNG29_00070, partial [Candidatus Paceibacterota bacterium]|nr:hypothetical protein [Candidatus Paceibacterota bacterium]